MKVEICSQNEKEVGSMLLKITRQSGRREQTYIKVVYNVIADEGLVKFTYEYSKQTFQEMLKKYFEGITWEETDDEGFDHYKCIIWVKTKEEAEEKEKAMYKEISELVKAFKDYLRELPEIEKKEWVWE